MSTNADIVAWICFVVGIAMLGAGVVLGLVLGFRKTAKSVTAKDATAKLEEAKQHVADLKDTAVTSATQANPNEAAARAATNSADAAESALGDIGSIVGALPENLRFAGLLVLVGTALMSVATVEFGGHSLF
jgi:3-hydroxyacyl-CoA dehydrogenase